MVVKNRFTGNTVMYCASHINLGNASTNDDDDDDDDDDCVKWVCACQLWTCRCSCSRVPLQKRNVTNCF